MPRPKLKEKEPAKRKKSKLPFASQRKRNFPKGKTHKVPGTQLQGRELPGGRGRVIEVNPARRPSRLRGRIGAGRSVVQSSGKVHKEFASHQVERGKGFSGRISDERKNEQLKNHVEKGKVAGRRSGAGKVLTSRPKESNRRRKKKK